MLATNIRYADTPSLRRADALLLPLPMSRYCHTSLPPDMLFTHTSPLDTCYAALRGAIFATADAVAATVLPRGARRGRRCQACRLRLFSCRWLRWLSLRAPLHMIFSPPPPFFRSVYAAAPVSAAIAAAGY